MKRAMLTHANRLERQEIKSTDDQDICNYFCGLQSKGYSSTYIAAVTEQASLELK